MFSKIARMSASCSCLALAIALTPSVAEASTVPASVEQSGESGVYTRVEKLEGDSGAPAAQPYAATPDYGPCVLEPTEVHVRTKTGDGDARIIGFKPVTKCSRPVTSIKHESKLKYQYWMVWKDAPLKSGVPTRSYNQGQSKLEQKNIEFRCNGLVDTNFIGTTTGTIVDGDKTYTATVDTEPFREACKV